MEISYTPVTNYIFTSGHLMLPVKVSKSHELQLYGIKKACLQPGVTVGFSCER